MGMFWHSIDQYAIRTTAGPGDDKLSVSADVTQQLQRGQSEGGIKQQIDFGA